jgi:hypothetical protein
MNKILRYAIIMLCVLIGGLTASARFTVVDAFKRAPVRVMPLLNDNTRLDLVDYFRAGQADHVEQNSLGGEARITQLSTDYMSLQLGEVERLDMFLLPAGNDTIIGVIQTLQTPVADSNFKLYNQQWSRLRGLDEPEIADWLSAAGKKQRQAVEESVGFMLVSYEFDPTTRRLTLTNHTAEWLDEQTAAAVQLLMLSSMSYEWTGHGFKKTKN